MGLDPQYRWDFEQRHPQNVAIALTEGDRMQTVGLIPVCSELRTEVCRPDSHKKPRVLATAKSGQQL